MMGVLNWGGDSLFVFPIPRQNPKKLHLHAERHEGSTAVAVTFRVFEQLTLEITAALSNLESPSN